jgi:hypothetical protein
LFDTSAERARSVAESHGCRRLRDSRGACSPKSTPSRSPRPPSRTARAAEAPFAAGVHALVEKPLAVTTAEADAILAAAERAGRTLRVGHVERFNPSMAVARERVGEPKFIEAHRLPSSSPARSTSMWCSIS